MLPYDVTRGVELTSHVLIQAEFVYAFCRQLLGSEVAQHFVIFPICQEDLRTFLSGH